MIPWDAYRRFVPPALRREVVRMRHRAIWSSLPANPAAVLIHVPKTAGTSLAHALYGHDINHYPQWIWRDADPARYGASRFVVVVREPLERLVSAIRHCIGSDRASAGDLALGRRLWDRHGSIDAILEAYLTHPEVRRGAQASIHFKPYGYWFDAADCGGKVLGFRLVAAPEHASAAEARLNVNMRAPGLARPLTEFHAMARNVLTQDYAIWDDRRLINASNIRSMVSKINELDDNAHLEQRWAR